MLIQAWSSQERANYGLCPTSKKLMGWLKANIIKSISAQSFEAHSLSQNRSSEAPPGQQSVAPYIEEVTSRHFINT